MANYIHYDEETKQISYQHVISVYHQKIKDAGINIRYIPENAIIQLLCKNNFKSLWITVLLDSFDKENSNRIEESMGPLILNKNYAFTEYSIRDDCYLYSLIFYAN